MKLNKMPSINTKYLSLRKSTLDDQPIEHDAHSTYQALDDNMIKLTMNDGKNIPQFFCDSCGCLIKKAGAAATVFANFVEEGETIEVKHVHKDFVGGNCLTKAEALIRANGQQPGWEELSTHVAYLVANVGLEAKDIAAKLESPAT